MSNAYVQLLKTPGALALAATSVAVRLPHAMISIGILIMLIERTGIYWLAATVAAMFTAVNAIVAPQVSRLIDKRGQRQVLPAATAFSVGALLALIAAVYTGASTLLLFTLAALAGVMPSMPSILRARWVELLDEKKKLHAAFALDAVITELAFVVGPPAAIGLSTWQFAEAGPLIASLLLVIGVGVFIVQCPLESTCNVNEYGRGKSSLCISGLPSLVAAMMALGVISGSFDVASVGFAAAQGMPAAAGYILAAYALGSMISGLTFGTLKFAWPIEKQLCAATVVTAASSAIPFFSHNVLVLSGMLFLAGISFAPTMVVALSLGTKIVPSSRITEGLTWVTTGLSIGVALGGILSGVAMDIWGPRGGFLVGIVAGVVMVLIVLSKFSRLGSAAIPVP